jgi:hypothetical protein
MKLWLGKGHMFETGTLNNLIPENFNPYMGQRRLPRVLRGR